MNNLATTLRRAKEMIDWGSGNFTAQDRVAIGEKLLLAARELETEERVAKVMDNKAIDFIIRKPRKPC